MNRNLCLLLSAVMFAGAGAVLGQAPPEIQTRASARFSIPTTDGLIYEIQGSDDGSAWEKLAGPVFGTGGTVTGGLPDEGARGRMRTVLVAPESVGPAPHVLTGKSVAIHDGAGGASVFFLSATEAVLRRGIAGAQLCSCQWRRSSSTQGRCTLTPVNGPVVTLDLGFIAGDGGSYVLKDGREVDAGVFSVHTGPLRTQENPGMVPADPAGRTFLVQEGSRVLRIALTAGNSAQIKDSDGTERTVTWAWNKESASRGVLDLDSPGLPMISYGFDLTADGSGTVRRQTVAGPVGPATPFAMAGAEAPAAGNCPPAELTGRSLRFAASKVLVLSFRADGTGTAVCENGGGGLELTPFRYNYSRRGDGQAALVVTYPGAAFNLVDEYDLDFSNDCDGAYTKKVTTGEVAGGTSRGSFTQGSLGG